MTDDGHAYKPATLEQVEIAANGTSPVDIYVFMQSSQKHLVFVHAGEVITPEKRENLKRLSGTNLWVRADAVVKAASPLDTAKVALGSVNPAKAFEAQVLGAVAGAALQDTFKALLETGNQDPAKLTSMISGMSDNILRVVAPETGDLKVTVLKSLKNIHLMNHAAAITSMGVLCALANDFRSRSALQHLSHAALMMDAALAELEPRDLDAYYRDRKSLPQHVMQKVLNHPVKSQQMMAGLPIANETVNQLILLHHELHNGKGYHRGLRTVNNLPLGRVLALAVDLYEHIKGAELSGTPLTLKDAILNFEERGVEPHQRRHSAPMVANLIQFLGLKATQAA